MQCGDSQTETVPNLSSSHPKTKTHHREEENTYRFLRRKRTQNTEKKRCVQPKILSLPKVFSNKLFAIKFLEVVVCR